MASSTAKKTGRSRGKVVAKPSVDTGARQSAAREARVVYTQAPVLLGKLRGRTGDRFSVDLGGRPRALAADPSVDPALLAEALEKGSRVVIDNTQEPLIVGVVATSRTVEIDRKGDLIAKVRRLSLEVQRDALIKSPAAFLRIGTRDIELYAGQVLTRARGAARILAKMVKLN